MSKITKDKPIGKITNFYDKIGVAVVKLTSGNLKTGDKIKLIAKDGQEFEQTVSSMQIEHKSVSTAKKGDEFGLKTDKTAKHDSNVIKIE